MASGGIKNYMIVKCNVPRNEPIHSFSLVREEKFHGQVESLFSSRLYSGNNHR